MTNNLVPRHGTLQAAQLDYILLDRSSSMHSNWFGTLAALDGYIDVLRSEHVSSHAILHLFNGREMETIARDCTLEDWHHLTKGDIPGPTGMTPLYDAINLAVRQMAALDPDRATLVITTDGDDTSSSHTTDDQVRALLDWCRARGWQVIFIGVEFNNDKQARLLGATEETFVGVQPKKLLEATKNLAKKRARYGHTGDDIGFTGDEKQQFGGYLSGPSAA